MQSEYDLIEELENLTVREIKRKCCELKISNYGKIYTKNGLIEIIIKHYNEIVNNKEKDTILCNKTGLTIRQLESYKCEKLYKMCKELKLKRYCELKHNELIELIKNHYLIC